MEECHDKVLHSDSLSSGHLGNTMSEMNVIQLQILFISYIYKKHTYHSPRETFSKQANLRKFSFFLTKAL